MNDVPPRQQPPEDLDDLYRRASAADPSRPSERARRAILDHAARLAHQRTARHTRAWRRPAIFGTLAAAALAGLLITPHFFDSRFSPAPQPSAARTEAQAPAAAAPPASPTPTAEAPTGTRSVALQPTPAIRPAPAAPSAPRVAPAQGQVQAKSAARMVASEARNSPTADLASQANAGVDLNARDADGHTALMLAVLHDQIDAVEGLLARGADPNAVDADGTTPLHAAVAGKNLAIVEALRRAGAR